MNTQTMRANVNVGDVIAIYRYGDRKTDHPSGIGVVVKIYDENRCFVRLLRNFSIPVHDCKPWKKMGIDSKDGYYVRREDRSSYLCSTAKFTYHVSATRAYATKQSSRSNYPNSYLREDPAPGYVKSIPAQRTEVYVLDIYYEDIPRFLMMRDLDSGIISVVIQHCSGETSTRMAERAYAKIQMKKWEKIANE